MSGGFCDGGILSEGFLSRGIFSGGIFVVGFFPGGFCRGDFIRLPKQGTDTYMNIYIYRYITVIEYEAREFVIKITNKRPFHVTMLFLPTN